MKNAIYSVKKNFPDLKFLITPITLKMLFT